MTAASALAVAAVVTCISLATSAGSSTLLLTGLKGIYHLSEDGKLLEYRNDTFQWWQDHHVAANPRNNTVCWVTAPENQDLVGNVRCSPVGNLSASWDLPTPKNFVVNKPNAMEIDHVTGNWFMTLLRVNYVCSHQFETCAKIDESGGNVRFYAAYDIPNRLLFLITTEKFGPYRIEVVGLDGSGRRQIADNSSVQYPTALAVDSEAKRVYWLDHLNGGTLSMLRCDHEGQNKELVAEFDERITSSHSRDLKIVGDDIFVMWGDQRRVSYVNKITREVTHLVDGTVMEGSTDIPFEGLLSLNVISDKLQPDVENACAEDNGGCSNLCLPSIVEGKASHTCICPEGEELVDTACFKTEPATVVAVQKNSLLAIDVVTEEGSTILDGLKNATKLDFYYKNKEKYLLFWVDDGGLFRGHWKVGGQVADVVTLVPAGGTSRVVEVVVDWYHRNVLWIERNTKASKYDDDGMKLKIASISGTTAKTVKTGSWRNPSALILQDEGINFVVHEDGYFGEMEFKMMDMDGDSEYYGFPSYMNGFKLSYKVAEIASDLSAISDPIDERYFWINPVNGSIEVTSNEFTISIKNMSVLLTDPGLKNAGGLDVYGDHVFWMDRSAGQVMTAHSETGQNARAFGPADENADLRAVRVLHPRKQPETRFKVCYPGNEGCSDMCLVKLVSFERTAFCDCPDGKTLGKDKKSCESSVEETA